MDRPAPDSRRTGRTGLELTAGGPEETSPGPNEHLLRFRRGLLYGLALWSVFFFTDWFVARFILGGSPSWFFSLRALGVCWGVVVLARLYRQPPLSERVLLGLDVGSYTLTSVLISLMTLEFEGIKSPYAAGIVTLLICRAVIQPEHVGRAWWTLGLPAAAYPLTLLAALPFSALLQDQLANPGALALFGLHMLFLLAAYGFMLAGGHTVWALREQVYLARKLGRYKLVEKLGAGAMGEVWKAEHGALRRHVAVKILRSAQATRASDLARFEREISALAELSHPNTVRVFDYGVTEDGLTYYAMELLSGGSLAQVSRESGPLAASRSLALIRQAALSLSEAHQHGIVHRDVKLENLWLMDLEQAGEVVKVLDFGVARIETDTEPSLTATGVALGTPTTIAPEVARGETADARSDVYSLGCVLYQLLTGQPPHRERNVSALLFAHMELAAEPPSLLLDDPLAPEVDAFVMRCLRKAPEDRFQTMNELVAALDLVLMRLTAQASAIGSADEEPRSEPRPLSAARSL